MKTILARLAWESVKAVLGKVAWKIVVERTISRGIVWGLRKLADMTTNELAHETVDDIVKQLNHPGAKLPEIGKEEMRRSHATK